MTELDVFTEHRTRFRAVTLQFFDLLTEEELGWRPMPGTHTAGQQVLHIAQNEDYFVRGIFEGDWHLERLRFPRDLPGREELRRYCVDVGERAAAHLAALTPSDLEKAVSVDRGPAGMPLRWWLWLMLEHEIHHKAQLAVYLRMLGKIPPYFAAALAPGERPDVTIRAEMGGL